MGAVGINGGDYDGIGSEHLPSLYVKRVDARETGAGMSCELNREDRRNVGFNHAMKTRIAAGRRKLLVSLASFGWGLLGVFGQENGWLAQAPGFTPGTIQVDDQGNVYVAAGINNTSTNAVIKYGPDGQELWRTGFSNLPNVGVATLGMGLDEEGNIYVAGHNQRELQSESGWSLVKFRPDGTQEWIANGVGGIRRMTVDRQGSVYAAGWGDAVKYGPDGRLAWHQKLPYPPETAMWAMQVAADGAGCAYLVGHNGWAYALTKVGPTGRRLWTSCFQDKKLEGYDGMTVAVDVSGNVFITGYTRKDIVTVKFDSNGRQQWAVRPKKLEETDGESASAIALDEQGRVYVSGTIKSFDESRRGLVTIAYDSTGREIWADRHRESAIHDEGYGTGLGVANGGNVFVALKSFCCGPRRLPVIHYGPHGSHEWFKAVWDLTTTAGLAVDRAGNLYVSTLESTTQKIVATKPTRAARITLISRGEHAEPTRLGSENPSGGTFAPTTDGSATSARAQTRAAAEPLAELTRPRIENSVFRVELAGKAGAVYEVQSSTDLADWKSLATVFCTDGVVQVAHEIDPRIPQRFYRALVKP